MDNIFIKYELELGIIFEHQTLLGHKKIKLDSTTKILNDEPLSNKKG